MLLALTRALTLPLLIATATGLLLLSCSAPPVMNVHPPDGGPPPLLTILTPPGPQIGLHYGAATNLRVSYRLSDAAHTPMKGQPVHFRFFGNPAGSTLSASQAVTDANGVAEMTLTAGTAETEFSVVVSAVNATDVNFSVGVSQLRFVALAVSLADPTSSATPSPSPAAELEVRLYDGMTCAEVGGLERAPAALQSLSASGPAATLSFINLIARSYAIEGRATRAGDLVADGCIDLPTGLLAPGNDLSTTVPLEPVFANAVGTYQLHSTFVPTQPSAPSAAWHLMSDCSFGFAQTLLDGIIPRLSALAVVALDAERGTVDANGCRKSTTAVGTTSLEASLQALLSPPGAPLLQLPAVIADLDSLTGNVAFDSILTVSSGGGGLLLAEHALTRLSLGASDGAQAATDLTQTGLPFIDARDIVVALTNQGRTLVIGPHGFTLHLGHWWRSAFFAVAVMPRFAMLTTPKSGPLLELFVAAASKGGMTGCAAVENLLCQGLAAKTACSGSVAPACTNTVVSLGALLDDAFGPETPAAPANSSPSPSPSATPQPSPSPGPLPLDPIDLTLSGQATVIDTSHVLRIDQLSGGSWTSSVGAASFTGNRVP